MRVTRKILREQKNNVNPLEELLIIIKQYFPDFYNWLDNLKDVRNQSYITLYQSLYSNSYSCFMFWY